MKTTLPYLRLKFRQNQVEFILNTGIIAQPHNWSQKKMNDVRSLWQQHLYYFPIWYNLPYTTRIWHYRNMMDIYPKEFVTSRLGYYIPNPIDINIRPGEISEDTWDIFTGTGGIRN